MKNGRDVRPADLRGFRSFGEDYPMRRRLLLYRGRHKLPKGDIICLPAEEFLAGLTPGEDLL